MSNRTIWFLFKKKVMLKRRCKKVRTIAVIQVIKYERYGFTSLEILSDWNGQIDKNKDSGFECKNGLNV